MPVKIQDGLPAVWALAAENVFVMTDSRAVSQDIRPMSILVLNLMPTKIATETQLLRVLGNTPLQTEVTFLRTATYESTNTDPEHLAGFYTTFEHVRHRKFDGLIITGAPVEKLPFESVDYWDELVEIMDWADRSVTSSMFICWGAQAALYHHYGIEKVLLDQKMSGVFNHEVTDSRNRLTRGFDTSFEAPHSRYTTMNETEIDACEGVEVLARSPEAGMFLAASPDGRQVFVTGHLEYDPDTLHLEYRRDVDAGLNAQVPLHYYPGDDPAQPPRVTWRAHAHLLFSNWLNYCVYQQTPYDLNELTVVQRRSRQAAEAG